jgi:hypothetical protein
MSRPVFYSGPWDNDANCQNWQEFKVGTCCGQWRREGNEYQVLAVINDQPGNGDFQHTLDYFYESCQRDKKNFRICCVWNKRLAAHLAKLGFTYGVEDDMIKRFK